MLGTGLGCSCLGRVCIYCSSPAAHLCGIGFYLFVVLAVDSTGRNNISLLVVHFKKIINGGDNVSLETQFLLCVRFGLFSLVECGNLPFPGYRCGEGKGASSVCSEAFVKHPFICASALVTEQRKLKRRACPRQDTQCEVW